MADKDIIFGKRAVSEAMRAQVPITQILLSNNLGRDRSIDDIVSHAESLGIEIKKVSKGKLDDYVEGLSGGAHQGIVALATPYHYATLEDALANAEGNKALLVVCDHITDAGNLGAIVRSAESVGAIGVAIPNRRCAQVTPVTYKTSAGAVAHVPIIQVSNISRLLDDLKNRGFWAVAATEHADDLLWDTDMEGRIALVVGNEHDGVSQLVLKSCDMRCKLPQMGNVSSLNVAQASTVFMYEWLRQNGCE